MDEIVANSRLNIRWEYNGKNDHLPIDFTGTPYVMLGKREYVCHQGKDKDYATKERYKEQKNQKAMSDHVWNKRRRHTQNTKKMDCPVKFFVKKIFRFTEYDLKSKDTKHNREKLNKNIRRDIENQDHIEDSQFGKIQYLVKLPDQQHCYHHKGEAGNIIQPTDEKVLDFIKQQIRSGCRRPKEIQSRVTGFVRETLFNNKFSNAASRKKYAPSRKMIRNIITSVKSETLKSKVDQENIFMSKTDWEGDDGKIFFTPYTETPPVQG